MIRVFVAILFITYTARPAAAGSIDDVNAG